MKLKKIIKGCLPYGIIRLVQEYKSHRLRTLPISSSITEKNSVYKNIHKNERCFILCSGPSIKKLDLKKLKNEKCISVASHYLHPDFSFYAPQYHCLPPVDPTIDRSTAIDLFNEMHSMICDATLFLSETEYLLVQQEELFKGRIVNYVNLSLRPNAFADTIPDITKPIPSVQSVPILALQLALYMGFSKIILLGTEHDSFITGRYDHFYEPTVLKGKDQSVDDDGRINKETCPLVVELAALSCLWNQYVAIKCIADAYGVDIVNATPGGVLDVFPRVKFSSLFKSEKND